MNPHPRLTWDSLNFVNLGTGTSSKFPSATPVTVEQKKLRVRPRLPKSLRQSLDTLVTIKTLATESENAAALMHALARSDSAIPLRYDRFSANTGVHEIKIDKYRKLSDIRRMTEEFIHSISQSDTPFDLCAKALADDYRLRRNMDTT